MRYRPSFREQIDKIATIPKCLSGPMYRVGYRVLQSARLCPVTARGADWQRVQLQCHRPEEGLQHRQQKRALACVSTGVEWSALFPRLLLHREAVQSLVAWAPGFFRHNGKAGYCRPEAYRQDVIDHSHRVGFFCVPSVFHFRYQNQALSGLIPATAAIRIHQHRCQRPRGHRWLAPESVATIVPKNRRNIHYLWELSVRKEFAERLDPTN